MSSPLQPSDETVSFERSLLDGTVIAGAAYGVLFTVSCQCLHLLLCYPRDKKIQWHLVVYVGTLFGLSSIAFGTDIKFNELTFVDNQNYPGGPMAYNFDQYKNPVNVASYASSFIASWFADAFLIYRLFVFSRRKWLVLVVPTVLLAGAIVISIILLHQIAHPSSSFWARTATHLGSTFWALTTSINVFVTGMFLAKIWLWRRFVNKEFRVLGVQRLSWEGQKTDSFGGTVAILLESAALSMVIGVFNLVFYVRGSPVMNVTLPVLGQVIAIAPLLVVSRVAQGSAWTQETARSTSRIIFDSRMISGRSIHCPRASELSSCGDIESSVEDPMAVDMCQVDRESMSTLTHSDSDLQTEDRDSEGHKIADTHVQGFDPISS